MEAHEWTESARLGVSGEVERKFQRNRRNERESLSRQDKYGTLISDIKSE